MSAARGIINGLIFVGYGGTCMGLPILATMNLVADGMAWFIIITTSIAFFMYVMRISKEKKDEREAEIYGNRNV